MTRCTVLDFVRSSRQLSCVTYGYQILDRWYHVLYRPDYKVPTLRCLSGCNLFFFYSYFFWGGRGGVGWEGGGELLHMLGANVRSIYVIAVYLVATYLYEMIYSQLLCQRYLLLLTICSAKTKVFRATLKILSLDSVYFEFSLFCYEVRSMMTRSMRRRLANFIIKISHRFVVVVVVSSRTYGHIWIPYGLYLRIHQTADMYTIRFNYCMLASQLVYFVLILYGLASIHCESKMKKLGF